MTVTLTALTPAAPQAGDTLVVEGRLTDVGGRRIAGAHLGVRVGGGGEVAGRTQDVPALEAGQSVPFTYKVPVAALGLGGAGDYALAIGVTGGDGGVLGLARTRLPWFPAGTGGQPLKAAVVWPVTGVPHMEALSLDEGGSARPVFRDDALNGEFAANGRLGQLVAAGAGLAVTWTVDPGLLDEAGAMAGGYRVATVPGSGDPRDSSPGTGSAAASAWLAQLRQAVGGGWVAALPYADPDLASLAHHPEGGLPRPVLTQAAGLGRAVATGALGAAVRTDVAWPYGGALDTSVTGLAGRLGLRTFLASGRGLGTGTALPRVSAAGGVTALVGDPAADAVLTRDLTGEGAVVAARQELLGDLLRARLRGAGSAGAGPNGIVVLPPRRVTPQGAQALAAALTAAGDAGWAELVGLDQVASAAPPTAVHGANRYPRRLRASELPAPARTALGAVQPALDTLSRVLADPARTTDAVHRAMLRGVSTGWRGDPRGAAAYAAGIRTYIDKSISSVHLLPKSGTVTVTGNSASVPVTLLNGLQQPLAGLVLRVTSAAPGRLTVDRQDTGIQAPAAASHTERIPVRAHANGAAQVTARLLTARDGRPWGAPITFQVTVSKISPGAVVIVLGCVLLLMLAALFRMRRARRRAGG